MAWNNQLAVAMPKKAFKGDDSPGFMVKLATKDVRLANELARSQGFEPYVGLGAQKTLERAMEKVDSGTRVADEGVVERAVEAIGQFQGKGSTKREIIS